MTGHTDALPGNVREQQLAGGVSIELDRIDRIWWGRQNLEGINPPVEPGILCDIVSWPTGN
jgi:hypothetical protein